MMKIDQINTLQSRSDGCITRMDGLISRLNAAIEKHTADKSRSESFILENVQAERDKIMPAISAELAIVRDVMTQTDPHQRYYESRALLMSLTTFDGDAAKDAQIKLNWRAELADTPAALLQLCWENAKVDNNLPLLWAIFHTGLRLSEGNAGFAAAIDMTLDGLTIPYRDAALHAISQCRSNVGRAETIAAVATGLRINPLARMNIGRQQAVTNRLATAAGALAA